MSDLSASIFGFVNVIKDVRLWEVLCEDMETFHCSLVDEIICSTTIK